MLKTKFIANMDPPGAEGKARLFVYAQQAEPVCSVNGVLCVQAFRLNIDSTQKPGGCKAIKTAAAGTTQHSTWARRTVLQLCWQLCKGPPQSPPAPPTSACKLGWRDRALNLQGIDVPSQAHLATHSLFSAFTFCLPGNDRSSSSCMLSLGL